MKNNKLRIAITGATGLLGRNLLFEIIKQNLSNLDNIEVLVLGRSKGNLTIEERMHQIIVEDGISYLSLNDKKIVKRVEEYYKNGIKYIHGDLDEEKLSIGEGDFKVLKNAPIDFFFHIAAFTDFRDTPNVVMALKRTNIYGTQQILDLIATINVKQLCYVSTAYACGEKSGIIEPDYIDFNQTFRNPYELTKLEAEILVRNFTRRTGIRCRYFRPSTICGRLIEQPLGAVNKFDVFYSWVAFFLRIKLKSIMSQKDKYITPIKMDMRICYNMKSGLNIVPADYAAKIMYQVCLQDDSGENYYLVNNNETPHSLYVPLMLETLNIGGARHVDRVPDDMNILEKLYYRTAGKVFTPYVTSEPMLFNTQNLTKVLSKSKISCPPIDKMNFKILMEYAKKSDFGIQNEDSSSSVLARSVN